MLARLIHPNASTHNCNGGFIIYYRATIGEEIKLMICVSGFTTGRNFVENITEPVVRCSLPCAEMAATPWTLEEAKM